MSYMSYLIIRLLNNLRYINTSRNYYSTKANRNYY